LRINNLITSSDDLLESTERINFTVSESHVGELALVDSTAVHSSGHNIVAGLAVKGGGDLSEGQTRVVGLQQGNDTSNVRASHGSSRDGVVGSVSGMPCRSDVLARGRDVGLLSVSHGGSLAGEGSKASGVSGGSNSNNSGQRVGGRVGSLASGSRVTISENRDDSSSVPSVDDVIVERICLSTSPGVADDMGGSGAVGRVSVGKSRASHELTAGNKSSIGTTSLTVQALASHPSCSWSNTDSSGSYNGTHGVCPVTVVVSGGLGSKKGNIPPSVVGADKVASQILMGWVDTGVDSSNNGTVSVVSSGGSPS